MALPVKDQIKYWTVAAALLLIFLWLLGDILLPFVLGAALAYLLDPIVDRLERLGTGRILGTTLVLAAAFLVIFFKKPLIEFFSFYSCTRSPYHGTKACS